MRIVIVGGGIGGLALAAGLRKHGFDPVVHERDTDPAATGGYHLTLDPAAQQALRQVLTPDAFEGVLASASAVRRRPPDVLFDWHGRELGVLDVEGHDPDSVDVDRITLRLLLVEAVGADLELGRTCIAVDSSPTGATAEFSDGSTASADVLVGADGPRSVVVRHLAGTPTSTPAGIVGVSGRTAAAALSEVGRRRLGPRSSLALGPGGTALYAGFLDPVGFAVLEAGHRRAAVTTGPTYVWGAMFPEAVGSGLRGRPGPELRRAVLDLLGSAGWSAEASEVVAAGRGEGVAAYGFTAGPEQVRDAAPWPAGRVTALGDAVHATPPTAGKGAGTAIVDAAALVEELVAVRDGEKSLLVGISDFERGMRHRGTAVVALSMVAVRRMLASASPVGSAVARVAFPVMAGVGAVRRRSGARA